MGEGWLRKKSLTVLVQWGCKKKKKLRKSCWKGTSTTLQVQLCTYHYPVFPHHNHTYTQISQGEKRQAVHFKGSSSYPPWREGNNQASSPRQSLTSDKPWKYWSKKCILLFQIPQGLDSWHKECSVPFRCPLRTKAFRKPCCSLMKPSNHCSASLGESVRLGSEPRRW